MWQIDRIPVHLLAYLGTLTGTTVLGALATVFNRKLFFRSFTLFLAVKGILFIVYPSFILPRSPTSVKLDGLHKLIGSGVGIMEVMFAIFAYYMHNSSDMTPRVSFLWSWTTGTVLKIVARAYLMHKLPGNSSPSFTEQEIGDCFSFIIDGIWIILLLHELYNTSTWGGYAAPTNQINFHIRVDQIFVWLVGFWVLAFPQWIVRETSTLDRLDNYHTFMSQIYACNYIIFAMIAGRAINFINNADKAVYLGVRTLQYGLFLPFLFGLRYMFPLLHTRAIITHSIVAVLIGCNTFLGFATHFLPNVFPNGVKKAR